MVKDVFLEDVRKAFASLAVEHLRPCLTALTKKHPASPSLYIRALSRRAGLLKKDQEAAVMKTIIRQLLCLQYRSQDVMSDFAGFYCLRLLLDDQSPLATYFIHLFYQLETLLAKLSVACMKVKRRGIVLLDTRALIPLLDLVQPVKITCRLLYVAYMILPRSERIQDLEEQHKFWRDEVKREGREHGRQFRGDEMHCRMRELGFTNLDRPGQSRIQLMEELGEGGSGTRVYKGVFVDASGSNVGIPVAVKMFAGSGSNSMFTMDRQQPDYGLENLFPGDGDGGTELCSDFATRSATYRLVSVTDVMGDAQLKDELDRLVSVKHPNIVTPIGYIGERAQAGDGGLVMELMDGSLEDYLEKVMLGSEPPLQELDMLDLMLEIAKGMQFLHENNLIHRDLKPSNVLLRYLADTDLGCKLILGVKIADFGLSNLYENGRGRRVFGGTSCYMAPEIRGDSLGVSTYEELAYPEKIDVFSFGTTCFNILIGDPNPRKFSKTLPAFYEAVRTGKWKEWPMQECIDKHLNYLVKLIGKCWEPEPAMRPTFATLCLLLQHAMGCHISAASLHNALGTATTVAQATNLQVFMKSCKAQHAKFYSPIISYYLGQRRYGSVIGLSVVTKCLLGFKSAIAADETSYIESLNKMQNVLGMAGPGQIAKQILLSGLVCNEDEDDAAESRDSLQWEWCNGKRRIVPPVAPVMESWEMMEKCLEKPDPLIFMKALPCHMTLANYCSYSNYHTTYFNDVLESEEFKRLEFDEFDFRGDEARSQLVVDTSLVPLLVLFWNQNETLGLDEFPPFGIRFWKFRLLLKGFLAWVTDKMPQERL